MSLSRTRKKQIGTEESDTVLEKQIREDLQFLFSEHGAEVIKNHYDAQVFGNAFIIIATPHLHFRVVRDRGEMRVEIAPLHAKDEWEDLDSVLNVIDAEETIRPRFAFDSPLSDIGRVLKPKFSQLEVAFSSELYDATLKRLHELQKLREHQRKKHFGII